MWREH
jgi:hypothetical protein